MSFATANRFLIQFWISSNQVWNFAFKRSYNRSFIKKLWCIKLQKLELAMSRYKALRQYLIKILYIRYKKMLNYRSIKSQRGKLFAHTLVDRWTSDPSSLHKYFKKSSRTWNMTLLEWISLLKKVNSNHSRSIRLAILKLHYQSEANKFCGSLNLNNPKYL